jgi:hypothetical protein
MCFIRVKDDYYQAALIKSAGLTKETRPFTAAPGVETKRDYFVFTITFTDDTTKVYKGEDNIEDGPMVGSKAFTEFKNGVEALHGGCHSKQT